MHFSSIRVVKGLALAGVAGALVACGGGGGGSSSGGPGAYKVTLQAAKTSLPANIMGVGPGIGLNAPYTTTVYVSARRENSGELIPGGDDVFACNVESGLDSGVLFYLNGEDEENEDGSLMASRSIVLGANSGGASFHVHATETAGTVTVRCSVQDTNGRIYEGRVNVAVGATTQMPSQIVVNAQSPVYIHPQSSGYRTQALVQAQILDDAGQPVPNPTANNFYARIVPVGNAAEGSALVLGTGGNDTWVRNRTVAGQAPFTVVSGNATGQILIEMLTDRADNNVDNGIQNAVSNLYVVDVADPSVLFEAPEIATDGNLPGGTQGEPYEPVIFEATGGTPPYTWAKVSGAIPPGFSTSSLAFGVLSGTPQVAGSYAFTLQVTDANGVISGTKAFGIVIDAVEVEPVPAPLQIATSTLPDATQGVGYAAFLTVSGGDDSAVTWGVTGLPASLTINPATGVISGTPLPGDVGTYNVVLTATQGSSVVNRAVSFTVN